MIEDKSISGIDQNISNAVEVFKFGGASINSALNIKNVANIIKEYGSKKLIIVVSAMGKTTNHLENVINAWWSGKKIEDEINFIKNYHLEIIESLFESEVYYGIATESIEDYMLELEHSLLRFDKKNYDKVYDQIISYGEYISSKIISLYLQSIHLKHKWVDAKNFIFTDSLFREARVDWELTTKAITDKMNLFLEQYPIVIQGFIGGDQNGLTTTLGREGSDYTASIIANCLDAKRVVVWKDVPGIMNGDPKKLIDAKLFPTLSYKDAIEMTFYGASVLHPKTIKPIENKGIPLHVKSFIHPSENGTVILSGIEENLNVPVIIEKGNQALIQISTKDLSFIAEENISKIFQEAVRFGININLMANTAIQFEICVNDMEQKISDFLKSLSNEFNIQVINGLLLLTVKNYRAIQVEDILNGREIVSENRTNKVRQFILKQQIN